MIMRLFLLYLIGTIWLLGSIEILSIERVSDRWQIDYMIPTPIDVKQTKLKYHGIDIEHTLISPPNSKLNTAIMLLIDTSIPMKISFTKGIKPTIKEIFKLRNPWDRWAIASFDSELKIVGDYNQTTPNNALNSILVGGSRTELYRASLQAISSLATQKTKRRFLFIFSDGEAEDNAYTYQEVISKAKESNVTIISFGYKDTIHLQSLRRISEESIGGRLFKADKRRYKLPTGYLNELNQTIHNNRLISFDTNLLQPNQQGKTTIELIIYKDNNQSISKEITIPVEKIITPLPTSDVPPQTEEKNLLYYVIGAMVLILLLLLVLLKSKKEISEEVNIVEKFIEIEEPIKIKELPLEPIAYLLTPSGSKKYIYKTHNSIGALNQNDIVIEGEYISRHHATLDFKDGSFFLIDNNSVNGLYVNYEKINSTDIKDEDIISFGPYEVTFKVKDSES